ncbi:hypothetical protein SGLAD_v1c02710 [Spiroplasma gladiatoris]|uniref:Uncharacterized protein n=1 Tax=Spiroplasma gladiatoris TaxID=2143 RepID=A0A4P7AIX1_9MOLU|nr:hypothetical protein [Spiroplasma gladiatoris]QBQ07470.1 hypothetical protein SGLAD_v1c02710 [Spiroplasma gladiatoris]
MRELTEAEKHEIIGGAGVTGALFTGISSIIKGIGSFISDLVNTGVTAGLAYKFADKANEFEYKNGSSSFKFSNKASVTAQNELDKKVADAKAKAQQAALPVAPTVSFY